MYLGIDIGGTSVKYGIVSKEGELLYTDNYPVAFDGYETPILDTVLSTSKSFLKEKLKPGDILRGIGVSATGQIDSVNGVVAGAGGNIKNWQGAKVKEKLTEEYHVPVTVINDANSVALGEKWLGSAAGYSNVLVITIGTGVGGGVIINDHILLGHLGFAGELGHFSINHTGTLCTCGNRGCYEQYASMTALVRSVREKLPLKDYPELKEQDINGKVIFDLIKKGDKTVIEVADQWIDCVAAGLVSLTHIFNPELIIIGGGVCTQEELFIAKVRSRVKEKAMKNFGAKLQIKGAALGNNAGLMGAVYYLMKEHSLS